MPYLGENLYSLMRQGTLPDRKTLAWRIITKVRELGANDVKLENILFLPSSSPEEPHKLSIIDYSDTKTFTFIPISTSFNPDGTMSPSHLEETRIFSLTLVIWELFNLKEFPLAPGERIRVESLRKRLNRFNKETGVTTVFNDLLIKAYDCKLTYEELITAVNKYNPLPLKTPSSSP